MNIKSSFYLFAVSAALFSCGLQRGSAQEDVKIPKSISLFNGKDIKDWTPKIRLHEVGENYGNTFRVEDGLLKVRYDQYDDFNQQYGHLAYNKPYGYYVLRVEYRFVGDQAKGGEGWAWRNSGAMLHGQKPQTMLKNQDFPISIEAQFLGGDTNLNSIRTTSNLCTPGTNVFYNNKLFTPHCVNSTSKTYHGDQWVTADFVVLGDSVVQHIINGNVVLEYYKPQIGAGNVSEFDPAVKKDGQPLTSGYIYIQSESHPIDFRKVELYDLEKYKDNPVKLNQVIQKIISTKKAD